MLAGRWTRAGALGATGALIAACSSSSGGGPALVAFTPEDCHGSITEVARFSQTTTWVTGWSGSATNNVLALDGDTLYLTYGFAYDQSGLPAGGGIVAVPVSGGAMRVVAAAGNTSQWGAGAVWVAGGEVYVQFDAEILSFPADGATPAPLPVELSPALYGAFVHDAEFGYTAQGGGDAAHLTVTKMPIAGGAPTTLIDEPLPNMSLGGMADAGDALLLQLRWQEPPTYSTKPSSAIWRIPKDGSPRSDVRPDVDWADALNDTEWLAWDGANILGPISVKNYLTHARIAPANMSAPQLLKLHGGVVTRRGDEILSFQELDVPKSGASSSSSYRLLVASSKGAPAGSVVACSDDILSMIDAPAGIAADDSAIYVAYSSGADTVIARATP